MQSFPLMVPHCLPSSQRAACSISSLLFPSRIGCNQALVNWLIYRSIKSKGHINNLVCNSSFNEFYGEDLSKHIEELAQRFSAMDDEDHNDKETTYVISEISSDSEGENGKEMDFSTQFLPSKLELLEPNLLGILPEPPDWPERDEIVRVSIERRANRVEIPLSLRIIKRKQKWEEGFVDSGDFAYCSVKKAFSSMVFIIREIQSYALHIRENLYCEDLEGIVSKVQRDMNASFVWLFQQVFSRTPTLMVYVMILLANFTVHSMSNENLIAATLSPIISNETILETLSITEEKNEEKSKLDSSSFKKFSVLSSGAGDNSGGGKVGLVGSGTEGGDWHFSKSLPSIQYPNVVPEEISQVPLDASNDIVKGKDESGLWNSMVEEASRMQFESRHEILDHQTRQQFVSPVTVELEPDDYEEYFRTDLIYQMGAAEEPNNPLILLNYAQFLYLVTRDHDRAEECFKRAIQVEPPDAEALSQYADFLWMVRNDLWEAEERYQQAMAAEPNNPYHASKYANFLWSTGGEETCFPLSTNYNKAL